MPHRDFKFLDFGWDCGESALAQRVQPLCDLVGGRSSMWVEMDHWLPWGVGDAGEAVAVELVDGLGDRSGADGDGLGVDGAAVRDVEVDEAADGRVLGRQGGGDHEDGAGDFGFGVADAAPGHGHSDACVKWGWCRPPLILPMRVCRR